MAVAYDSRVLYTFAERLYRRASVIVLLYGGLGLLIGFLASLTGVELLSAARIQTGFDFYIVAFGSVITGGLGAAIGVERGFALRLQAQMVLCQVKIEEHTRHVAMMQSAAAPLATHAAPFHPPR